MSEHDEAGRAVTPPPPCVAVVVPPPPFFPPPPHPAATSARAPMRPTSAAMESRFLTLPPLSLAGLYEHHRREVCTLRRKVSGLARREASGNARSGLGLRADERVE